MKVLSFKDLKERGIPWSRVHINRLEKDGKFPTRIHLGGNTVAWDELKIDAWLAERAGASE